jgi:uncharacterized membrane protein YvbJ
MNNDMAKRKKQTIDKKILLIIVIGFIAILFLLVKLSSNIVTLSPENVATSYLVAWSNKDYETMYSLISDGFKEIEPTAKDLETFIKYFSSKNIDHINIIKVGEISNNGTAAIVNYYIELFAANQIIPYGSSYTLKYRINDQQPGWKIINPYGMNIDTT